MYSNSSYTKFDCYYYRLTIFFKHCKNYVGNITLFWKQIDTQNSRHLFEEKGLIT